MCLQIGSQGSEHTASTRGGSHHHARLRPRCSQPPTRPPRRDLRGRRDRRRASGTRVGHAEGRAGCEAEHLRYSSSARAALLHRSPEACAASSGPDSGSLLLSSLVPHHADSVRPRGLQPARLLRPWGFPGKDTGVPASSSSRGSFRRGNCRIKNLPTFFNFKKSIVRREKI